MGNYKRCPLCNEKIVKGRENMIAHIQKEHEDEIPMGQKAGEFLYLTEHNGEPRKCMICRKPTKWNEGSHKYNAFCSEKCKNEYVKLARARNKKVYGKENLLNDPEQQKKMLAHRSISGKYRHSDGGVLTYTGSYEEDFCEMMDNFLNFPSDDIIMPSPHVYEYNYRGEKKFYFPDAFIPSLSLEIEIKDGGDNPNMHHKIQDVDKVKEHLKDQVMFHQQDFHYIKIENKNYDAFFKLVEKLSEDHLTEMERLRKIKIVPESPTPIYEQVLTEEMASDIYIDDEIDYVDETLRSVDTYLLSVAYEEALHFDENDTVESITKECYDQFNELNGMQVVTEGILSSIWNALKSLAKNVVKLLVKLWKGLVNFVKGVWNGIKRFLGFKKNASVKIEEPITAKFITIESAQIDVVQARSKNDIKKAALDACKSIAEEIRYRSQIQIESSRELEKYVEGQKGAVTEAKILYNRSIKLTKSPNSDFNDTDISIPGNDVIDHDITTDLRDFRKRDIERVLSAEDIVAEYKFYLYNFFMEKAMHSNIPQSGATSIMLREYDNLVRSYNFEDKREELMRFFTEQFFVISEDPEVIKRLLTLRINYNKKITNILANMARINYKQAGYSEKEIEHFIEKIKDNDVMEIDKIYYDVSKDVQNLIVSPGHISFKKYGGGDMFYYYKDINDPAIGGQFFNNPSYIYSLSLRWDCIINTHGGDQTRFKQTTWTIEEFEKEREEEMDAIENNDEIKNLERRIDELYKKRRKEKRRLIGKEGSEESYKKYAKEIRKQIKELEKKINDIKRKIRADIMEKHPNLHNPNDIKERYWSCLPVKINDHQERYNLYDAIRDAIEDGYRRILILACNPGHLDLPSDIKQKKNVIIKMSKNITYSNPKDMYSDTKGAGMRSASIVTTKDFGIN